MINIYGITIVKLYRISKIPKTWEIFSGTMVYIYGITIVESFRTGEIHKELDHKYFNLDSNWTIDELPENLLCTTLAATLEGDNQATIQAKHHTPGWHQGHHQEAHSLRVKGAGSAIFWAINGHLGVTPGSHLDNCIRGRYHHRDGTSDAEQSSNKSKLFFNIFCFGGVFLNL